MAGISLGIGVFVKVKLGPALPIKAATRWCPALSRSQSSPRVSTNGSTPLNTTSKRFNKNKRHGASTAYSLTLSGLFDQRRASSMTVVFTQR